MSSTAAAPNAPVVAGSPTASADKIANAGLSPFPDLTELGVPSISCHPK